MSPTPWIEVALPALLFVGGVALLVYCVEHLIESLARAGAATRVSPFFLSVVFVGLDFENWAFGVAAVLDGLPGIAVGSAVGSALFLCGVAVPVAGLLAPFRTRVPRDYLAVTGAAPFVLLPCLLDGVVGRLEGALLMAAMAAALTWFAHRERSGRAVLRDPEAEEAVREGAAGRSGIFYLALSALLVIGVVVGSELAVRGAGGVVAGVGLDETAFGMTVVGMVMSLEEVLLVVRPVRKERVSVAVGNVLGSLVFFATGNVGLLALAGELPVSSDVLTLYFPFLAAATLGVVVVLWLGRVDRWTTAGLGVLYAGCWVTAYL